MCQVRVPVEVCSQSLLGLRVQMTTSSGSLRMVSPAKRVAHESKQLSPRTETGLLDYARTCWTLLRRPKEELRALDWAIAKRKRQG